jgi:hypothetical protein
MDLSKHSPTASSVIMRDDSIRFKELIRRTGYFGDGKTDLLEFTYTEYLSVAALMADEPIKSF